MVKGNTITKKQHYYCQHMCGVNPLRAKFFRGNINIHLHFVSLLNIDVTQVLKIVP